MENGEQKIYENGYTINERVKNGTFFSRNAYSHAHIYHEKGRLYKKEATKRRKVRMTHYDSEIIQLR